MKKLMLVASTLMIGTTGPVFAAGDETGGGLTSPDPGLRTTSTYSQPADAPETRQEEMTMLEYFLQLLKESTD